MVKTLVHNRKKTGYGNEEKKKSKRFDTLNYQPSQGETHGPGKSEFCNRIGRIVTTQKPYTHPAKLDIDW
jgi:hypothetical protein